MPFSLRSAISAIFGAPWSSTLQCEAKSWISAWVYSRRTVPGVARTPTTPDLVCAAAGLIAGTVPTKGTL